MLIGMIIKLILVTVTVLKQGHTVSSVWVIITTSIREKSKAGLCKFKRMLNLTLCFQNTVKSEKTLWTGQTKWNKIWSLRDLDGKKEKKKGRKSLECKGHHLLVLGFPGRSSFINIVKQNKTCSGFRVSPAKKQKLYSRDLLWLLQVLKKEENI